jgi:hypothetical protein
MSHLSPLELLKQKLESLRGDLQKAQDAYDKKLISKKTYGMYVENITPNIQKYKDAVQTLIIFGP